MAGVKWIKTASEDYHGQVANAFVGRIWLDPKDPNCGYFAECKFDNWLIRYSSLSGAKNGIRIHLRNFANKILEAVT